MKRATTTKTEQGKMEGAKEYCRLFEKAEQFDRLYLLPHCHARGKTFRIYVLPEGEDAIENGGINPPLNDGVVEVYGVVGGNPGWSEEYGWLHKGKWQEDFRQICHYRRKVLERQKADRQEARKALDTAEENRIAELLENY